MPTDPSIPSPQGFNPADFLTQLGIALTIMSQRDPAKATQLYMGLQESQRRKQQQMMLMQKLQQEQTGHARQLQGAETLQKMFQPTLAPGVEGPEPQFDTQQAIIAALQADPSGGVAKFLSSEPFLNMMRQAGRMETAGPLQARTAQQAQAAFGEVPLQPGEKRTFAPSGVTVEQQHRMTPEDLSALGSRMAQSMGSQPATPQGQPQSGPPTEQSRQGPQYVPTQSINIDESGNLSVKIGQEVVKLQSQHLTRMNPQTGRAEIVQQLFNPVTGQMMGESVVGQAESKEMIMKAEIIARERYRLQPTDPRFGQVVQAVLANTGLSDRVQGEAMAALDREFLPRGGTPPPSAMPSGQAGQRRSGADPGLGTPSPTAATGQAPSYGDILEAAHQRDVRQAVQKTTETTTAEQRVQREEGRLPASVDLKVSALDSVGAGINAIRKTYNPQFVGKGFQIFNQQLRSEVAKQRALANKGQYEPGALQSVLLPGGMGGMVREYTGAISSEEVAFRRSVVDIQDVLLRARSGAQINESEFVRLSGLAVRLTDEPAVFQSGLDRFEKAVFTERRNTLRGLTESPKQQLQRAETELQEVTQRGKTSPTPATTPPPLGGVAPNVAQGARAVAEQFSSGKMTRTQARQALLDLGVQGSIINQFLDRLIGGKKGRR